ncbi:MAG TPA: S41 family peptidase [Rhizomicrobium sp.]|jgi:carboxyl-terminal processing protease|nr:S41 family peptidase [Rhizomicrobium sp.]
MAVPRKVTQGGGPRRRTALVSFGLAAGFVGGLILLPIARSATGGESQSAYQELDRFGAAFATVRANYPDVPDDRKMVEDALNGMISDLDPHSSYFDPKTFAEMQVKTSGSYGGVGLVISAEEGSINVVSPIDDTPASRAGVKAGDRILAIDGKGLQGLNLDKVQDLLRGPSGTKVNLTLLRPGAQKSFEVALVRAAIQVEAVKYHREGNVGYIRIPAFNEETNDGVVAAVKSLRKQIGPALQGYIIDLRDDGGGVLDQAIAVSDDFLDGGEVVSTRGRRPDDTQRYDAKPGDITDGKPLVVLINGGTASASEIVAGALQDHRRATIVGMTSFGKGSVQTIIPLSGGADGALHLTTARYYTPSGRSIQATGIVPDVAVAKGDETSDFAKLERPSEADLPHHLTAEQTIALTRQNVIRPPAGSKIADFQLAYAVKVLTGRMPAQHQLAASH